MKSLKRSMVVGLCLSLSAVGLVTTLLFGFVAVAAFSDAQHLDCPGADQCSDAIDVTVTGAALAVVGLLALLIGVRGVGRMGR